MDITDDEEDSRRRVRKFRVSTTGRRVGLTVKLQPQVENIGVPLCRGDIPDRTLEVDGISVHRRQLLDVGGDELYASSISLAKFQFLLV